jgi:tetratricopeptide (TPR) repeat protein
LLLSCATTRTGSAPPAAGPAPSDALATAAAQALIRGDYPDALARADKGIARYPLAPWLHYNRGAALAGLARNEEALEALKRAEQLFPRREAHGRAVVAYRRALLLEFAGRCPEAATAFADYAALTGKPLSDDDMAAHVRACVAPSQLQAELRRQSEELRLAYEDPVRREVDRRSTAAVEALTRGDAKGALAQVNAGLVVAPNSPWLLYNKGAALAALGQVDEAAALLRAAQARFSPADTHGVSVAIYRRALAYEQSGRCDEAGVAFEEYAQAVRATQPLLAEHARAHVKLCRAITQPGQTL